MYMALYEYMLLFFMNEYIVVEWLWHIASTCLTFSDSLKMASKITLFYLPSDRMRVPVSPQPNTFGMAISFLSYSDGYAMVSHCEFNFHFHDKDVEHFFIHACAIHIFFW